MKKLVALERIYGLFSNLTFAEKNDEVEFVEEHDDEISMYRNLRTKELFFARNKRIGLIDEADIFLFVETETKKQTKISGKKIDTGNDKQTKIQF